MRLGEYTMDDAARLKRVRWRCRRGTRELDVLYGWWLDNCWADADETTRAAFDVLLDTPDPELWAWTIGQADAPRADWQAIIDVIRSHHNL